MSMFFGILGIIGFITFLAVLIVAAILKKSKRTGVIGAAICFVLFIMGIAMHSPGPDTVGLPACCIASEVPMVDHSPDETIPPLSAEPVLPPIEQPPDTLATPLPPEPGPAGEPIIRVLAARVIRVTNGDTVRVRLETGEEERVRFIGVDAPESTRQVEPFGQEAAAFTKARLEGKPVYLELDIAERDRFGRILAYVWLSMPDHDGEPEVRAKMFNAKLLAEGYAEVMTIPPNVKYADLFVKLHQEARHAGKGLWGRATEPVVLHNLTKMVLMKKGYSCMDRLRR